MKANPINTSFAVIITSYNYRAFVEEAVDTALAQTRAPKQVIVVDDGSTDGSPDLLRARYGDDPRVTLLCGENGGQLVAFQRGIAAADADVLCFLDADDRWEPDYLTKIGEVYDTRQDVGFVFSDITRFGNENKVVGEGKTAIDYGYTAIATYALAHWYGGPTSALTLRAELAARCVDLPEKDKKTWRLCADAALVYGASVLGARKYYLPTQCVGYRVHGSNGWWSNRSAVANYVNRLRAREIIESYALVAGLSERSIDCVKYEFRTKPCPPWKERKKYMYLSFLAPAPIWKRVERAASVLFTKSSR